MKRTAILIVAALMACAWGVCLGETQAPALPRGFVIRERASLSVEDMLEIFGICTGYEGTAGASLKEAIAAERVADYARECGLGDAAHETLREAVDLAWNALADEARTELSANMQSIGLLLETAFHDYPAVQDLFEDAGVGKEMRGLIASESEWYRHWTALRDCFMEVTAPEPPES